MERVRRNASLESIPKDMTIVILSRMSCKELKHTRMTNSKLAHLITNQVITDVKFRG